MQGKEKSGICLPGKVGGKQRLGDGRTAEGVRPGKCGLGQTGEGGGGCWRLGQAEVLQWPAGEPGAWHQPRQPRGKGRFLELESETLAGILAVQKASHWPGR